ncbi:PEP-CTERM sorting domain-containing protein [Scytonema sp. UIC 10036]|uniref:PEP-CTERM sorting domain-containing protein n=1 Tax=Scytonema sp. UIC 10036 TaxID=2304196 RepID=UPI0012DAAD56|nr:PEP-CTERM sorting domain-containing protein [Scytonema sp. UIC 10036]MUG94815.1 PEP-CTERM sorting domain-containing protein [Scytonema sp. UIC 10036]
MLKIFRVFLNKNFFKISFAATAISLMSAHSATAATFNLDKFIKLPGLTGGNPKGTAVYYAEISNLPSDIKSITIADSDNKQGGTTGRFSGFDLDAIKISNILLNDAANINSISSLNVFDFTSTGVALTPGTQRDPVTTVDAVVGTDLFGAVNGAVDNSVATLQSFDANSTSALVQNSANPSTAFGFISLGDGGKISFNLKDAISSNSSPLYLYIGEVGDNGEVVNGEITLSDKPVQVPEPTGVAAFSLLGLCFAIGQGKKRTAS